MHIDDTLRNPYLELCLCEDGPRIHQAEAAVETTQAYQPAGAREGRAAQEGEGAGRAGEEAQRGGEKNRQRLDSAFVRSLFHRLRRICNHPLMVQSKYDEEDYRSLVNALRQVRPERLGGSQKGPAI